MKVKNMTNDLAIELVQFKLAQGKDEKAFLEASDEMMIDLKKQSGFIDRELLKGENNLWVDIVHWKSLREAEQAAKNVMSIPSCLKFFEMINQESIKMMHLDQVREYK